MSTTSSEFGHSSDEEDDGRPILIPEFTKIEPRTALADTNAVHPNDTTDLEALTPQQLQDRVAWCNEIRQQLVLYLEALNAELHSEWAAKEDVLEQILQKETGADWRLP